MFDVKRIGKFDAVSVGKRIKMIRKSNHITTVKLAEMTGISRAEIWNYENGKRGISTKFLFNIAAIFDVSTDYILGSMSTDAKQAEYIQSEELGLSVYAIECLQNLRNSQSDINIIEDLIVSLSRNHKKEESKDEKK